MIRMNSVVDLTDDDPPTIVTVLRLSESTPIGAELSADVVDLMEEDDDDYGDFMEDEPIRKECNYEIPNNHDPVAASIPTPIPVSIPIPIPAPSHNPRNRKRQRSGDATGFGKWIPTTESGNVSKATTTIPVVSSIDHHPTEPITVITDFQKQTRTRRMPVGVKKYNMVSSTSTKMPEAETIDTNPAFIEQEQKSHMKKSNVNVRSTPSRDTLMASRSFHIEEKNSTSTTSVSQIIDISIKGIHATEVIPNPRSFTMHQNNQNNQTTLFNNIEFSTKGNHSAERKWSEKRHEGTTHKYNDITHIQSIQQRDSAESTSNQTKNNSRISTLPSESNSPAKSKKTTSWNHIMDPPGIPQGTSKGQAEQKIDAPRLVVDLTDEPKLQSMPQNEEPNYILIDSSDDEDNFGKSDVTTSVKPKTKYTNYARGERYPRWTVRPATQSNIRSHSDTVCPLKFHVNKDYNFGKSRQEALAEQERLLNSAQVRMRQEKERTFILHQNNAFARDGPTFTMPITDVTKLNPNHFKWLDLHARMGLPKDATKKMIKSQYRSLALAYHPDKCKLVDASARFHAVTEAYHALAGQCS